MEADESPFDQLILLNTPTLILAELPEQKDDESGETLGEGSVFCTLVACAVLRQPLLSVIVTVKVATVFTVIDCVVAPVLQAKLPDPFAVKVVVAPVQNCGEKLESVAAVTAFTVTVTIFVEVQPLPSVIVTV